MKTHAPAWQCDIQLGLAYTIILLLCFEAGLLFQYTSILISVVYWICKRWDVGLSFAIRSYRHFRTRDSCSLTFSDHSARILASFSMCDSSLSHGLRKGDLLVFVLVWQCWLKRQKDPLDPEIHDSCSSNPWTSGLVFEKDVVWHPHLSQLVSLSQQLWVLPWHVWAKLLSISELEIEVYCAYQPLSNIMCCWISNQNDAQDRQHGLIIISFGEFLDKELGIWYMSNSKFCTGLWCRMEECTIVIFEEASRSFLGKGSFPVQLLTLILQLWLRIAHFFCPGLLVGRWTLEILG